MNFFQNLNFFKNIFDLFLFILFLILFFYSFCESCDIKNEAVNSRSNHGEVGYNIESGSLNLRVGYNIESGSLNLRVGYNIESGSLNLRVGIRNMYPDPNIAIY